MKKLLPFLFVSLILLAGCKDDDEDDGPKLTTELLQGTWKFTSEKYEYYDATNKKIYEETDNTNSTVTFSGQSLEISSGGFDIPGTYTLNETNDKNYIVAVLFGQTENIEVTNFSSNTMTWKSETPNDTYEEGGVTKTAAKSISTVQLQKQP